MKTRIALVILALVLTGARLAADIAPPGGRIPTPANDDLVKEIVTAGHHTAPFTVLGRAGKR